MTEQQYRAHRAIANSDLTEFKNFMLGIKPSYPTDAFALGSAVHRLILTPNEPQPDDAGHDEQLAAIIAAEALKNNFVADSVRAGVKERPCFFTDPATGLACKMKPDIQINGSMLVDLKTTSARSHAAFVQSCQRYEYFRQAAFYLDGSGADCFALVGIQKFTPFEVFVYIPSVHAEGRARMQAGRQDYQRLLGAIARHSTWEPSSWYRFAGAAELA